jgi:hypothetical protein
MPQVHVNGRRAGRGCGTGGSRLNVSDGRRCRARFQRTRRAGLFKTNLGDREPVHVVVAQKPPNLARWISSLRSWLRPAICDKSASELRSRRPLFRIEIARQPWSREIVRVSRVDVLGCIAKHLGALWAFTATLLVDCHW